uniref:TraX family protein n=1 Tax=Clostridium sp. NkU-1 TaxID=1095009 RepID=UPI0032616CF7
MPGILKKYGARLFLFALISEIPFDLAIFDQWFYPDYQNVYFTLFIGLCVLYWYDKALGNPIRQTLVFLAGCGAAVFLKCDYDIIGIVMILLFYVFHKDRKTQTICAGILQPVRALAILGRPSLLHPYQHVQRSQRKREFKIPFFTGFILFT